MRRFAFSLAVLALVAAANPCFAEDSATTDETIAQAIVKQLREQQDAGRLKGFDIDLNVENGRVTLTGNVKDEKQHQLAIDAARFAPGVKVVVNDLKIDGEKHAHPAQQPIGAGLQDPLSTQPKPTTDLVSELRDAWSQPAGSQFSGTTIDKIDNPDPLMEIKEIAQGYSPANSRQQVKPIATIDEVEGGSQFSANYATVAQTTAPAQHIQSPEENIVAASPAANWEPRSEQVASAPAQPVAATQAQIAPQPQQVQYIPVPVPVYPQAAPTARGPVAYAASQLPGSQGYGHVRLAQAASPQQIAPAPQFIQGTGSGMTPARYDHPNMPGYAWPSYASHPNYAALQYPKQYSAHAWPYIGPFYPYPQVPLGWRKVTLSWDDGWWHLDFKDRGYGPYVTR